MEGELFLGEPEPGELAGKPAALLEDPDLRQRMGGRLRGRVLEEFGWERAVKRYAEAYLMLVGET